MRLLVPSLFLAAMAGPFVTARALAQTQPALPPLPTSAPTPPPPPPPAAPPTAPQQPQQQSDLGGAPLDENAWHQRFAEASDKLNAHAYDEALALFTALVAAAPSDADRALALHQVHVAADMKNGVAPQGLPPPSTPPAPPAPSAGELPPTEQPAFTSKPLAPGERERRSNEEIGWLYASTLTYGFASGLVVDGAANQGKNGVDLWPLVGTMIGVSGLGSAAVAVADAKKIWKYGMPQSITTGLHIGFEQGLAWALMDAKNGTTGKDPSYLQTAAIIWSATSIGAVGGGIFGAVAKVTPGEVGWVGSLSLWPSVVLGGAAYGVTAGGETTADLVKGEHAMGLVGGVAGLAGMAVGMITAPYVQPSALRVRLIDVGGFGGALLGVMIGTVAGAACSAHNDNCRPVGAFTGIAIGSGIGAGAVMLGTAWMKRDPVALHWGKALDSVQPSVTPTQGGAVIGLGGSL